MRLRQLAGLATLVLTVVPVAPATAAPFAPRCLRVAVSPAFAKDGTAFCVTWRREPKMVPSAVPNQMTRTNGTKDLGLYRTADHGRSWRRVETDLPWDVDTEPGGIALSPLHATEPVVAIHLSNYGVYTSTDGGEHFLPADLSAISAFGQPPRAGHLTGFAVTAGPRTSAAFGFFDGSVAMAETNPANPPVGPRPSWNGNSAIVPVPGGHVPATGAPGLSAYGFQLSATFGSGGRGYVLTYHVETYEGNLLPPTWRAALWRCDTRLNCTEQAKVFPDNWGAGELTLLDKTGERLAIVLVEPSRELGDPARLHVWRSTDAGATWRPWTAVERIVAPFNASAARNTEHGSPLPRVLLAVEPASFRRVAVRVTSGFANDEHGAHQGGPMPYPAEQVWLSDDGGARFRRTAYGPTIGQRGRGTLPWHGLDGDSEATLVVAPGGRILTTGVTVAKRRVTYAGIFCSRDGRSWARVC